MSVAGFPILYVDDDRANLASFQYLLADRFQILTASHSDEALRILAAEETAVLLADQRMESGMSGVELCSVARERFPGVVRMLVTAYADVGTLQGGINDARISAYIAKPWNEDEMVAKLRAAVDAHRSERLLRRWEVELLRGDQLTVSSFVVGHLLGELCNPATAVRDNLDFSSGTLAAIEAGLSSAPATVQRRFRELRQALVDASGAAETLVARIAHFRSGEAAVPSGEGISRLGPVVGMAAAIMREEMGKRALLAAVVHGEAVVAVDPFRIARIVAGLLVDALESVAPGAPARNRVIISAFATATHGGVSVEAAGPEVRPCSPSTLFDPFPAAPETRARALGLAVIRDLVETARGEMNIEATGTGTLVRVQFPLVSDEDAGRQAET